MVQFARFSVFSRDIRVFRKLFRDNLCLNHVGVVRISCGRDIMTGKKILRGCIFKPSKPDLCQERFQKELNVFIEDFTDELQCERNRKKPENKIVSDFAKEYLSIQKTSLSPGTYDFYQSKEVGQFYSPCGEFYCFAVIFVLRRVVFATRVLWRIKYH